jgi:predicted Zn-dependent protease
VKLPKLKNLTLVLAVLLVLGGAGAFFGGKAILRHRAMGWRRDGIAAAKAGDHVQAAFYLGGYLRRYPDDTEALQYYVASRPLVPLANGQHYSETINALKVLVGQDPNSAQGLEYRHQLLELYVKLERTPEALDTGKAILAKKQQDVRALELMTELYTKLKQFRPAYDQANAWAAAAPMDLHAHMARLFLMAQKQLATPPETITEEADKLLKAHPDDPRFELLKGYAHGLVGDRDLAAQWLRIAAKHPKLDDDLVKTLVAQFDALALTDESTAVLEQAVKNGAARDLRYVLAKRYWQVSKWQQLEQTLADLDLKDPRTDATLIAFRAMALTAVGKKPDAAACAEALEQRAGKKDAKDAVAAAWSLLLRRGGGAKIEEKDIIAACKAAISIEPDNSYLRYFVGEAEERLGEQDLAAQSFATAAVLNPIWGLPASRLVDNLVERGRSSQAIEFAAYASRRNPRNAAVIISYARAWAAGLEAGNVGRADELLKLVSDIQQKLPGEEKTFLIQLQLLAQKPDGKEQAIKMARTILDQQTPPPAERVLLAIAGISQRYGLNLEDECYNTSEEYHGVTLQLAYARALAKYADAGAEEGLKRFDEVAKAGGHEADLAWQVNRARFMDATNHPGAAAAWITLADRHPEELAIQRSAVNARSLRGDWDFVPRAIERIKAIVPDGLEWRLAKARLLIESARNDTDYEDGAKFILDDPVFKAHGNLPEPHALRAHALAHLKRMDGAINEMSQAAKLDPGSVPIALQLAAMLQSRGDFERVRQEIDRLSGHLNNPAQRQQAALLLARQGNQDRAIALLQGDKDDAGGSKNGDADSLLMAVLYNKQGEFEKAEAIVRKLLDEKPDLATIQFAASLYASKGRRADSERVLAKLDGLKLEPGVKELVWASYYSQLPDLNEAMKHYRAATTQASGNAVAWRALATSQMGVGKSDDALATVTQGIAAVPDDKALPAIKEQFDLLRQAVLDADLHGVVLAYMRDPAGGSVALELMRTVLEARRTHDMARLASRLEQLAQANPTALAVQVQLIRCLSEMKRTNAALAAARQAMAAFPEETEPARLATQLCAADHRVEEMLLTAQAWRQRAVSDRIAADVAVAEAMILNKQFDSALSQIQPYLATATADPDHHADVMVTAAIATAGAGRVEDAAKLLWPLAEKSAVWRRHWVEAGMEFPDADAAIAWLNRLADITAPEAIDERVVLAEGYERLGKRFEKPELIQKSTDMFADIAGNAKVTPAALVAAAAQAERAKSTDTAIALYRRAVAMDGNLWVAKNNLAMLLVRGGGDIKEAHALAADAVKLQPHLSDLRDTLAAVEDKAGNPKQAAETIRTAVLLEPDNLKWYVGLAKYLLAAGEHAEASKAIAAVDAGHLDSQGVSDELKQQLDEIRARLRKVPNQR